MSMLKTIKGAISNVQQVGASINKSLKKNKPKLTGSAEGVNVDAGAELLNRFQEHWADIHERSANNAQSAERVANVLKGQYQKCEKQNAEMNQLLSLVSTLPQLMQNIAELVSRINDMEKEFAQVEGGLVLLTDLKEQEDVIINTSQHHRQLATYRARKDLELEQVKKTFAEEHTQRMAGYEAKLQEHLQDKQQAFEEAFAKEMEHYREYGNTQMRPLLANSPPKVELADIALEQDNSALDDFLGSDEVVGEPISEIVSLNEDRDEEDETYVNISVNINLSDPEQEMNAVDQRLSSKPEAGSDPECDIASPDLEAPPESELHEKKQVPSDENQNQTLVQTNELASYFGKIGPARRPILNVPTT